MVANGQLPLTSLAAVSGVYLNPTTAAAFIRMSAACHAATGVSLDIVNYWGGYRDLTMQRQLAANPPAGISVAAAGSSTHGFGKALDITTTCYTNAVANWCRRNCNAYGFTVPPSRDPRHFAHNGITTGPAATPAATPISQQEIIAMTGNIDYAFTPEGVGYAITQDGGAEPMTGPEWAALKHLRSVQDAPDSDAPGKRLPISELVTISEFLRRISAATAARTIRPLLTALNVDVDEAAIVAAIAAQMPGNVAIPTAAAIAAAVSAELADDFAAIPNEVIDAEAERLSS